MVTAVHFGNQTHSTQSPQFGAGFMRTKVVLPAALAGAGLGLAGPAVSDSFAATPVSERPAIEVDYNGDGRAEQVYPFLKPRRLTSYARFNRDYPEARVSVKNFRILKRIHNRTFRKRVRFTPLRDEIRSKFGDPELFRPEVTQQGIGNAGKKFVTLTVNGAKKARRAAKTFTLRGCEVQSWVPGIGTPGPVGPVKGKTCELITNEAWATASLAAVVAVEEAKYLTRQGPGSRWQDSAELAGMLIPIGRAKRPLGVLGEELSTSLRALRPGTSSAGIIELDRITIKKGIPSYIQLKPVYDQSSGILSRLKLDDEPFAIPIVPKRNKPSLLDINSPGTPVGANFIDGNTTSFNGKLPYLDFPTGDTVPFNRLDNEVFARVYPGLATSKGKKGVVLTYINVAGNEQVPFVFGKRLKRGNYLVDPFARDADGLKVVGRLEDVLGIPEKRFNKMKPRAQERAFRGYLIRAALKGKGGVHQVNI